MTRRNIGKKFSFSTEKHIEHKTSRGAECVELHLNKEELIRMVGAAINSVNATPEAQQFMILCWKKTRNHHCTVYPR